MLLLVDGKSARHEARLMTGAAEAEGEADAETDEVSDPAEEAKEAREAEEAIDLEELEVAATSVVMLLFVWAFEDFLPRRVTRRPMVTPTRRRRMRMMPI